ncbi:MAG: hypothetical protein JJU45_03625 [Acidimicrobiia bacterium]|nr:hypothetical protein [Acidimicrobiia bacterium]
MTSATGHPSRTAAAIAIALAVLLGAGACTTNEADTPAVEEESHAQPSTSPPPSTEPPPGAFSNRGYEPPALTLSHGGASDGLAFLSAESTDALDRHHADPEATAALLAWAQDRTSRPTAGPHDTTWAGASDRQRIVAFRNLPLPADGPSVGCSEHWISVVGFDGNEITRLAPGICIGQDDRRPAASITWLYVYPHWVSFGSLRRPDVGVEPPPPHVAELNQPRDVEVEPDTTVDILPAPGGRDPSYYAWEIAFDAEDGTVGVYARRVCLAVYVRAGDADPDADGVVTFDLDVRDTDDQPIDHHMVVPPRASPNTLTVFSIAPLPLQDPATVTLTPRTGEIHTWALAARGC